MEVAWTILRGAGGRGANGLAAWANRIAARRGKRIAAAALARRVAGILFAMWRDATDFQPSRTLGREVKIRAA
jgi:transposase